MFIKNIIVIIFVVRILFFLEMWWCFIGNLYMFLYILCYLVKGGSLFDFGGFIIVVFFEVIDGFVRKRENLGSWFFILVLYLYFLLFDE